MAETKIKDRITVVDMLYHQRVDKKIRLIESRFSRELEISKQPYEREFEATEEWQPLDCGWLEGKVGMLAITNDEGRFLEVIPTEEEREAVALKVLEIAYDPGDPNHHIPGSWLVPPGESMRGSPSHAESLEIRCQSGTAKFTLHLLPK